MNETNYHNINRREPWMGWVLLLATPIFLFATSPIVAFATDATLSISPSTGNYNVNEAVTARLYVSSDGAKISGTEGVLSFNPKDIEVKSISREGSILTSWPEPPSFDNEKGEIKFGGIMATTTIVERGRILSITLVPLRVGSFRLEFVNGAATIIAADGTGGNVVSSLKNALYTATPSDIADTPSPETTTGSGEVLGVTTGTPLSSPTHPYQDKWYRNGTSTLTWGLEGGVVGLRLGIDQKPTGTGKVSYAASQNTKTIPHLAEGIWYFHLTEEFDDGSEKTSQYRLQIDLSPPTELSATEVPRENSAIDIVTIAVSATDALSGIDHYEFSFDKGAWVSWTDDGSHQFHSEKLSSRTHEIIAAAVDGAGNRTETTLSAIVELPPPPRIALRKAVLKEGEILPLEVDSTPSGTVEISISWNKDTPVVEEFKVDETGKGEFSSALILKPGTYQAWAVLIDVHGIRSAQSAWLSVEVGETFFGIIKRHTSILMETGGALLFFILIFFFWRRSRSPAHDRDEQVEEYDEEEHIYENPRAREVTTPHSHQVILGEMEERNVFEPTRL